MAPLKGRRAFSALLYSPNRESNNAAKSGSSAPKMLVAEPVHKKQTVPLGQNDRIRLASYEVDFARNSFSRARAGSYARVRRGMRKSDDVLLTRTFYRRGHKFQGYLVMKSGSCILKHRYKIQEVRRASGARNRIQEGGYSVAIRNRLVKLDIEQNLFRHSHQPITL